MTSNKIVKFPSRSAAPISANPAADKGTCANPKRFLFWTTADHRWTRWEFMQTHNIFRHAGDPLPVERYKVYCRECVLCGKTESYREKI